MRREREELGIDWETALVVSPSLSLARALASDTAGDKLDAAHTELRLFV